MRKVQKILHTVVNTDKPYIEILQMFSTIESSYKNVYIKYTV